MPPARPAARRPVVHESARARLLGHAWPGNVRELRQVIERALALSAGDDIGVDQIALDEPVPPSVATPAPGGGTLRETLEAVERRRIEEALAACGGNQSAAADEARNAAPHARRAPARLGAHASAHGKAMNGRETVAVASHAVLSAYVGYALWRGAKSEVRRDLAKVCIAFALFSVTNGFGYVAAPPVADVWFDVCNVFAFASAMYLLRFAVAFSGWRRAWPGRRSWYALLAGAIVLNTEASVRVVRGGEDNAEAAALGLANLALMLAVIGLLARVARSGPRSKAARAFLRAVLWPLLPLVYHIGQNLGLDGSLYGLVRNISLLMFLYSLLIAYLDHADEPMSLRDRFVAGTLTVTLGTIGIACELFVDDQGRAVRMLLLALGASVVVIAVFPLFYRRNLVEPLDRLVGGMRQLEAGRRDVSLPPGYDDELGYVTRAFNNLVVSLGGAERDLAGRLEELRGKNQEVRALNDELRQQVAARSRQLAEALELADPSASRRLQAGDVVDGRYRVGRVLGAGGMGTVYDVERLHDGRHLALKVVQTTTSENITRFAREAQIAAPLDHENLVAIIDVGIWRGLAYLVMELVEGGSLEDQRARFGEVPWALPLLAQMAGALAALHERGVVHRDLKPANVLLSTTGGRLVVKITDFGIAFQGVDAFEKTLDARSSVLSRLTATGVMVGTLPYMAPELALGGARAAGAAADMFAFGLIAHELLTGRSAFDVPPVLVARSGLPSPAPLPPGLGAARLAAIDGCLHVKPEQRPTALDVVGAFARA